MAGQSSKLKRDSDRRSGTFGGGRRGGLRSSARARAVRTLDGPQAQKFSGARAVGRARHARTTLLQLAAAGVAHRDHRAAPRARQKCAELPPKDRLAGRGKRAGRRRGRTMASRGQQGGSAAADHESFGEGGGRAHGHRQGVQQVRHIPQPLHTWALAHPARRPISPLAVTIRGLSFAMKCPTRLRWGGGGEERATEWPR